MKDKFLDPTGLSHVWENIKKWISGQHYASESEIPTVPTDISAFNNDVGYITNSTSLNYKNFPEEWVTDGGMIDLIRSINGDTRAEPGMSYMDTVFLNDLPAHMGQGEMMVDIISKLDNIGKVIRFTLTSTERYPYHWEYTSAYGQLGTWRGYIPDNGYIYLKDGNGGEWKLSVNTSGGLVVTSE